MPDLSEFTTEAGAIAALVGAAGTPVVVNLEEENAVTFVPVAPGASLARMLVDDLRVHPRWPVATPEFDDDESFVTYARRYWIEGRSIAFAGRDGAVQAVFDYHDASDAGNGEPGLAGRGAHTATVAPRYTDAWKAWTGQNARQMTQEVFLEFLEERIGDIAAPDGATLQEIIRFFRVNTAVGFQSGRNLTDGTASLTWTEDAEAAGGKRGELPIPTDFQILLRPYRDGTEAGAVFAARLRWRIAKPQVQFSFHIVREALSTYLDEVNERRRLAMFGAGLDPIIFGARG